MADNIDVQPGERPGKMAVATKEVDAVHYPYMIVMGKNDAGDLFAIPVDDKGHLEVALHEPRLPFGSVHTESLTPVFQVDSVYGVNEYLNQVTTGRAIAGANSASVTGTNNLFTCSTGTTSYSFGALQSKNRLRYRPGQGVVNRFTALWSSSAATTPLHISIAGCGTAESGFYFGYRDLSGSNPDFGILHVTDGIREIQTLTVTTASTTTESINITLGGTVYSVAVTNSGDVNKTAYEISQGTYAGWAAEQVGDTVVFLAADAANKSGTVSISTATTAVGSGAVTLEGQASTDTWIPQSEWNGDKLDGTGPSGVTINPQTGNVFQIDIQYLGFGGIVFKVETCSGSNNPNFVTVHTLQVPNTRTTPTLSQPSFPFNITAYSAGSTTDVSISCASYAGFIEGKRKLTGPRFTYTGTKATTTTIQPVGTIRNDLVFNDKPNQSTIQILDLNFTSRSSNNTYTTLYVFKNITLTGTPVYSEYSTFGCSDIDTSATGLTFANDETDNHKLVWSASIMELGTIHEQFPDEIILQPGETLTFAVATSSGTGFATVSINTREDH